MRESAAHARFPRRTLFGAAALVGLALVATSVVRFTGIGATHNPTSVPVERRALRFEDRADGAVVVYAAEADQVVEVLTGTNGFVRSVLRGLARDRKLQGVGREPAFELTRWADGRLSLADPSTGRSIELDAFGHTNASAFAELLTASNGAH